MNEQATTWQRQKSTAIAAMFGVSLIMGILIMAFLPGNPPGGMPLTIQLVGNVLLFIFGFRWLSADSAERDIRRPLWLNIGVILLAAVFVPYYLYKTRPAGGRLSPILNFYGLVLGCAVASAVGATLMGLINPPAVAPVGL
ncbi:MAG: hypothetical protein EYC71_03385 [Gammaproteobacteria bacterium]|nr:MAG: hypothetical protein EYC71_03385 [Gammaproteobacteria bacterium]